MESRSPAFLFTYDATTASAIAQRHPLEVALTSEDPTIPILTEDFAPVEYYDLAGSI